HNLHTCVKNVLQKRRQICRMVHRGEILRNAVEESGVPITRIARSVNKSRRWLYNQFDKPDVGLDTLIAIGRIIHHDFSSTLPELRKTRPAEEEFTNDPQSEYNEE